MRTEVEVKLPVNDVSQLETEVFSLGFAVDTMLFEEDAYYDNEEQYIRKHNYAFRIRKDVNLLKREEEYYVNFKGVPLDQVTMTREEHETTLEHPTEMIQIFTDLGFHAVQPSVRKKRTVYKKEGNPIHLCMDIVEGLGSFLEAEIICDESKQEESLSMIVDLISQLGYSLADSIHTSYLSMLRKKMESSNSINE